MVIVESVDAIYASVFVTNKIPSGLEKHHESTEPESTKTAKMFFFFFLFFFLQMG